MIHGIGGKKTRLVGWKGRLCGIRKKRECIKLNRDLRGRTTAIPARGRRVCGAVLRSDSPVSAGKHEQFAAVASAASRPLLLGESGAWLAPAPPPKGLFILNSKEQKNKSQDVTPSLWHGPRFSPSLRLLLYPELLRRSLATSVFWAPEVTEGSRLGKSAWDAASPAGGGGTQSQPEGSLARSTPTDPDLPVHGRIVEVVAGEIQDTPPRLLVRFLPLFLSCSGSNPSSGSARWGYFSREPQIKREDWLRAAGGAPSARAGRARAPGCRHSDTSRNCCASGPSESWNTDLGILSEFCLRGLFSALVNTRRFPFFFQKGKS